MGPILRVSAALLFSAAATCLALAEDDASDKAAFEKVCGACHATTMIHDLKTQDEWIDTVNNMSSIGAKGTDAQFDAVLRYLARNFTKVNINTAPASQIAPVLDIDEATAQSIVDYRLSHGSFTAVEELEKLPGLDAAKIEARKERIAFR